MVEQYDQNMRRILLSEAREGASRQEPEEKEIFARWLTIMNRTRVPFIVGGAFAVHAYTGIWRDTKDLDIFIQPRHLKKALDALREEGFTTEVRYLHWLAKVHQKPYVMDLIFGVWNGRLPVTEDWFSLSKPGEVAGVEVRLIGPEELISSKLYVATRDRFDGGDVVHLIRHTRGKLNWERILSRLGENYELLLWHLILFNFVYPGHTDYLPKELMVDLFERLRHSWSHSKPPNAFRGTLLDQFSFVADVKDWGYEYPCNLTPLVDEDGNLL